MTVIQEIIEQVQQRGWMEVLVTPEIAKALLAQMPNQRGLSNSRVDRYVGMMRRGEWVTGPPIAIDEDGNVIEGQHRLRAVIKLGKPVTFIIITGLDPDALFAFDRGGGKSLGDLLRLRGEKSATRELASALSWLHRYRTGAMRQGLQGSAPTAKQAFELLDANPGIRGSLLVGMRTDKAAHLSRSLGTMLHYVFSEKDADEAEIFFEYLKTGDIGDASSPLHILREKLKRNHDQPQEKRLSQQSIAAITVKAWNSWLRGEPRGHLRFRTGGSKPEPFPDVLGPDDV